MGLRLKDATIAFDEEGKQFAQPGQGRGKTKMQMKRWTFYISKTSVHLRQNGLFGSEQRLLIVLSLL